MIIIRYFKCSLSFLLSKLDEIYFFQNFGFKSISNTKTHLNAFVRFLTQKRRKKIGNRTQDRQTTRTTHGQTDTRETDETWTDSEKRRDSKRHSSATKLGHSEICSELIFLRIQ